MRSFSIFAVASTIAVFAAGAAFPEAPAAQSGFAVVELFTSEGCSSCPPADETLGALTRMAEKERLPVFALEWHVDYWDYLGWKDSFDSRFATERQYAYSRALPSSVYTPQMILNGSVEPSYAGDLAGVERTARSLIAAGPDGSLRMEIAPGRGPRSFDVRIHVARAPADSLLLLAITEEGLSAAPTAGENAGRRLMHSNVVRAVKILPAVDGVAEIDIPPGVVVDKARLVALVQEKGDITRDPRDRGSMRILAATQGFFPGLKGARISGRVVDRAGRGVEGARIQACSGAVCVPALSDSQGFFAIGGLAPGRYAIALGASPPVLEVSVAGGQDVSVEKPLLLGPAR